jgi:hypothetical protein
MIRNSFGQSLIRTNHVMKPIDFPCRVMLAALLGASETFTMAQTVDTSTGTILDSNTSPTALPEPNRSPSRLTATIRPTDPSFATNGEMVFIVVGEAVSVSGRIAGLEPNKRYQAMVHVPLINPPPNPGVTATQPSQAGAPDAGPPQAAPPSAPAPAAGKPDGEMRPGAPGGGSEGTPITGSRPPRVPAAVAGSPVAAVEVDLGMIVADAQGITNLNVTLMNKDLSRPPNGIQGCTVVIKRAPPLDSREERNPVGAGVIVASQIIPVPAGP